MTIHPKTPIDLMLAPVAVAIDRNLQQIRDKSVEEIDYILELELDFPAGRANHDQRVDLILRQALLNVDMHGWSAAVSDDGHRVHLSGGSASIDLALSPNVAAFIQYGLKGMTSTPG